MTERVASLDTRSARQPLGHGEWTSELGGALLTLSLYHRICVYATYGVLRSYMPRVGSKSPEGRETTSCCCVQKAQPGSALDASGASRAEERLSTRCNSDDLARCAPPRFGPSEPWPRSHRKKWAGSARAKAARWVGSLSRRSPVVLARAWCGVKRIGPERASERSCVCDGRGCLCPQKPGGHSRWPAGEEPALHTRSGLARRRIEVAARRAARALRRSVGPSSARRRRACPRRLVARCSAACGSLPWLAALTHSPRRARVPCR